MTSPTNTLTIGVRCSGNPPTGLLGKTKYNVVAITAANFDAKMALLDALELATVNITKGIVMSESVEIGRFANAAYPSAPANRGRKWILTASNSNGRKFTYTIPAADPDAGLQADNRTADLTATHWAAYKSAFEAAVVDPAGNALTLRGAVDGGRRR